MALQKPIYECGFQETVLFIDPLLGSDTASDVDISADRSADAHMVKYHKSASVYASELQQIRRHNGVTRYESSDGIRMALGARPRDVLLGVAAQGLGFSAVGITLGAAASLALTKLVSKLLFGIPAGDPATFVVVGVLLLTVASAASYLGASSHADRSDPGLARGVRVPGRLGFELVAVPQWPGALQILSRTNQLDNLPDMTQIVKGPLVEHLV